MTVKIHDLQTMALHNFISRAALSSFFRLLSPTPSLLSIHTSFSDMWIDAFPYHSCPQCFQGILAFFS